MHAEHWHGRCAFLCVRLCLDINDKAQALIESSQSLHFLQDLEFMWRIEEINSLGHTGRNPSGRLLSTECVFYFVKHLERYEPVMSKSF